VFPCPRSPPVEEGKSYLTTDSNNCLTFVTFCSASPTVEEGKSYLTAHPTTKCRTIKNDCPASPAVKDGESYLTTDPTTKCRTIVTPCSASPAVKDGESYLTTDSNKCRTIVTNCPAFSASATVTYLTTDQTTKCKILANCLPAPPSTVWGYTYIDPDRNGNEKDSNGCLSSTAVVSDCPERNKPSNYWGWTATDGLYYGCQNGYWQQCGNKCGSTSPNQSTWVNGVWKKCVTDGWDQNGCQKYKFAG